MSRRQPTGILLAPLKFLPANADRVGMFNRRKNIRRLGRAQGPGLHPKDTLDKLRRVQKLAKHLREEIAL
jgi:hypothetical protein